MRWLASLLWVLGAGAIADPLTEAQARFRALQSYQATVRATTAEGDRHEMRYFYRKPGWVRMEFTQPHAGAVLVYNPGTQRVRVWPFGQQHRFALSMAPDNPLLRGPHGRRVDRSDVGVLLERLLALRERGGAAPMGETTVAGRRAIGVEVAGAAAEDPSTQQRFRVWFAHDSLFPLRVEYLDGDGRLVETVDMSDAQVDVGLPERLFAP